MRIVENTYVPESVAGVARWCRDRAHLLPSSDAEFVRHMAHTLWSDEDDPGAAETLRLLGIRLRLLLIGS